jgi:serine kinase of HPr protein (carbohydrate metabolism regulator)
MLLFVLKKKDYLLLHGSAVCGIDAGIIFMGDRGSGKSTIAASLCSSGYKMLCDDVVPISKGGIVRPGIPRPKLLYDAVENVLSDFSGVALKFDGYDKYHADLPFCEISKKIKLIIQLQTKKLRTIEIEKLLGIDRLMATLRNAIFLEGLETPEEHFLKASEFLSFVPVFTISRPDESYSLEAVVDAVQRLYNSPLD